MLEGVLGDGFPSPLQLLMCRLVVDHEDRVKDTQTDNEPHPDEAPEDNDDRPYILPTRLPEGHAFGSDQLVQR